MPANSCRHNFYYICIDFNYKIILRVVRKRMRITSSIVVHKTPREQLEKVLDCLLNSSVDKIYIVDNSPTEELRALIPGNEKIEYCHVENRGFGAGHNIGIRKSLDSGAEYHLVLNPDVVWGSDIIKEIADYMTSTPDIGLISPKTFYPDGSLQYTCRLLPTPIDMFLRGFLPDRFYRGRTRRYQLEDFDHERELNVPYLLGSFMFFRNETLRETGLFDERFFMYPEDIDITRRIHRNWKTIYWPEVTIIHEHQQASKKNVKMFLIHFSNMVRYFNKWGWILDSERKKFNEKIKLTNKSIKI